MTVTDASGEALSGTLVIVPGLMGDDARRRDGVEFPQSGEGGEQGRDGSYRHPRHGWQGDAPDSDQ